MKQTLLFLAIASLSAAASLASAAEAIQDGGFEVHDPWTWVTPFPGIFGTWNEPKMSGTSVQLGQFGGLAGDYVWQAFDLSAYGSATLSFDLTTISHGAPELSTFAVAAGYDNEVYRIDVGSNTDGLVQTRHVVIPLTSSHAFMPNSILTFTGWNEAGASSRMFVDNVSIRAQAVPEPAPCAALGLGAVAVLRRRRK